MAGERAGFWLARGRRHVPISLTRSGRSPIPLNPLSVPSVIPSDYPKTSHFWSPLPPGEGQDEGIIAGADLGVRPNFIEWMECLLLQQDTHLPDEPFFLTRAVLS